MHPYVLATIAVGAGFVIGTIYGRKFEQQIVGATLNEFAKVDAAARDAVARLHLRLTYLKKYVEL